MTDEENNSLLQKVFFVSYFPLLFSVASFYSINILYCIKKYVFCAISVMDCMSA